MAFITMAQALQVIGQAPVQHGKKTATEGLRIAKSTFPMFGGGGGVSGLMEKVMGEGPGAMLKNPMAALSGSLGGQLSGMVGKLQGAIGGGAGGLTSLISSIGGTNGLQSAIGKLTGTANSLVGLPGTGQFDLQSVMGHAGLSGLGVNLPASVSMERVVAPVMSNMHLNTIAEVLVPMVDGVVAGSYDPGSAQAQVEDFTRSTLGLISGSDEALMNGQMLTMASATVSVVTSALADQPTGIMGDFLNAIVNPDSRALIQAHQDEVQAMFARAKAVQIPT